MGTEVEVVVEGPRGCGYRKEGGLYLRTDPVAVRGCGKLPLPLAVCPCCGEGFPPSRAPRWIDPGRLFAGIECRKDFMPLTEPEVMAQKRAREHARHLGYHWRRRARQAAAGRGKQPPGCR